MMEEEQRRRNDPAAYGNAQQTRYTSHYRPVTATYGLSEAEKSKVYDVLQDASNASWVSKPTASQSTVPQSEEAPAIARPSPTPSNADFQPSGTPTFEQLTNSYIASMQNQNTTGNPSTADLNFQDMSSMNTLPSFSIDPGQTLLPSSALPTGLDPSSFDTWMNLFLQSIPPSSFEFSPAQLGDFSSATSSEPGSHSSTPGPMPTPSSSGSGGFDEGTFATIPPSSSGVSDMMLGNMFNQPVSADAAFDQDFFANANFDFGNMDLNMGMDMDFGAGGMDVASNSNAATAQVASPIPSSSSFTSTSGGTSGSGSGSVHDPSTPASAAWDISLPDVHMAGVVW
ncbi:hypothetical protein CPB84DRAFT_1233701 [Gymnopilus junonius]|uniref:Uncharacterized protein n=1 Tax=Gymnopilus junonius TaxID=109634 RepID=A0A9P5P045_GYMJU|nr:hypothetical protein CPB84DRAFT_1233701 [Gymnopilus junonius]